MGQIIIMLIALVLAAIGVVCIFDARLITKKMFSFGDQNEGSLRQDGNWGAAPAPV